MPTTTAVAEQEIAESGAFTGRVSFNAFLNCSGQMMVAGVAVLSLPRVVGRLGVDAFGVLSLIFTGFGATALLDLGLGRATAKFVAEFVSVGRRSAIGQVVATSVMAQLFIGGVAGTILFLSRNRLAEALLATSNGTLLADCAASFGLLACSVPFVLGSMALRGALEGAQRFDLVNAVKIPLNLATYLIPWIAVRFGRTLPEMVAAISITRLIGAGVFLWLCIRAFPSAWHASHLEPGTLSSLFRFAGWSGASSVLAPVLTNIERYYLASVISIQSVSYYTIPFEIVNGLAVIPASISAVLFPTFSRLSVHNSNRTIEQAYLRGTRFMVVLLAPICITLAAFSFEILQIWQGPGIATHASGILKILAIGVFTNSLVSVPLNFVAGAGRPDLVAKIHTGQVVLYGGAAYCLIAWLGVPGAAGGFSARVTVETSLLFCASSIVNPSINSRLWKLAVLPGLLPIAFFGISTACARKWCVPGVAQYCSVAIAFIGYCWIVWRKTFDAGDRHAVVSIGLAMRELASCK